MASWLAACLSSDIYSTIVPLYGTVHHINSKGMRECNGGKKGKGKEKDQTRVYVGSRR